MEDLLVEDAEKIEKLAGVRDVDARLSAVEETVQKADKLRHSMDSLRQLAMHHKRTEDTMVAAARRVPDASNVWYCRRWTLQEREAYASFMLYVG